MRHLPISGFLFLEAEEAEPELAQRYEAVKQETGQPHVPNWAKALASSYAAFDIYLDMLRAFNRDITLPQSLIPIILYSVATARNCTYCSATNELYCRTLGVDEETLELLAKDIESVSPMRLRVIIQFAVKCALRPQQLKEADFERIRGEGISDDEIIQITFLAALANFNDTLADTFKMDVDPEVLEALGR